MVYVDRLMKTGFFGGKSCHLTADNVTELKLFACGKLGLKVSNIHERGKDSSLHFDLTPRMRELAIQRGALERIKI